MRTNLISCCHKDESLGGSSTCAVVARIHHELMTGENWLFSPACALRGAVGMKKSDYVLEFPFS